MSLVLIEGATYLWMMAIYLLVSLQLILIAFAIGKTRREVSDMHTQLLQTLRTVGPLPSQIASTFEEVQKGNKDQQEIKARLTNLKQNVEIVKKGVYPLKVVTATGGTKPKPTKRIVK